MVKMRTRKKSRPHGEKHPRAVLTDHEVELVRELREVLRWSYCRIAEKMGLTREGVRKICLGMRR